MHYFSIKDLERLSGVKAHTIRIWESRHNAFIPQRTHSNIRYYDLSDLKRLLGIAFLLKKGYRISNLVAADEHTLEWRLSSYNDEKDKIHLTINNLLVYMFMEDTECFESELDHYIRLSGIDKAIHNIIIPFLRRSDILSYSKSGTEVHFAVTAVRKKIIYGIETLHAVSGSSAKALLFLSKDEHYDLILLYMNYVLKTRGIRVLYLGTDISIANLEKVVSEKRPDVVMSYNTVKHQNGQLYAQIIEKHLPQGKLYIIDACSPASMAKNNNTTIWTLDQLTLLKQLSIED